MKSSKTEKDAFVVDEQLANDDSFNSDDVTNSQTEKSEEKLVNSDKKGLLLDNESDDFALGLMHAEKPKKSYGRYEAMITTVDNPFDPFDQFDDWFRYDEEKGYHTCSYLGRIAKTSDEMSDEEFSNAVEQAIDQIIKYDFMNIYKKVKKETLEDQEIPKNA